MAISDATKGIKFPTLYWRTSHAVMEPLEPISAEFTCLVSIARIGLVTLEGSRGRAALEHVGHYALDRWRESGRIDCDADPSKMREYVDHFLERVRGGFPRIVVDSTLEFPHALPLSSRVFSPAPCEGVWDGNRADYVPGMAVTISINAARFGHFLKLFQKYQGQKSEEEDDEQDWADFITYEFVLGARFAVDLCHAFLGFLAGGQRGNDFSFPIPPITPPNGRVRSLPIAQELLLGGDAGRELQQILYGGYLEIYKGMYNKEAQPGIPKVINKADVARGVTLSAITGQIWNTGEDSQFPLGTEQDGTVIDAQWRDKFVKMVYDNNASIKTSVQLNITGMTEEIMRQLILHCRVGRAYRVVERDMCWAATQPGRLVNPVPLR